MDEMTKLTAIKAVRDSLGGQILIDACRRDAGRILNFMRRNYATISHAELMGHAAALDACMTLFETLTGIEDKITVAEAVLADEKASRGEPNA